MINNNKIEIYLLYHYKTIVNYTKHLVIIDI